MTRESKQNGPGFRFDLDLLTSDTSEILPVTARLERLIVGGWAGRSDEANQHHIAELQAIGVTPPRATPMFYRLAPALVTSAPQIDVVGHGSSGEAEAFLLRHEGDILVGVGSDHTDRQVETYGVTVSKQVCAKPVGRSFWRLADVANHWDSLVLRSWSGEPGAMTLYQEGSVAALLDPRDLLARFEAEGGAFTEGCAMFCGTMPVIGPVRMDRHFRVELSDSVLGRSLSHEYTVNFLEIVD